MAQHSWQHPIFIEPPYYGRKSSSAFKKLASLTSIVLVAIIAAGWHNLSYALADEPGSGELIFNSAQGTKQQAVLMDTNISASIQGIVAEVTYEQHFVNRSNDWREGIYQFPLPENASVNFMQMQIGERIITGSIKEKQAAKKAYAKAKAEGKKVALTEQNRSNLFTQRVANIGPNETIIVTLRFLQTLNYENEKFEWRLPTTFTPRYIPGKSQQVNISADSIEPSNIKQIDEPISLTNTGWALPTDQVPDADEITPPMVNAQNGSGTAALAPTMQLNITLNAGLQLANIQALYHAIDINKNSAAHHISLTEPKVIMDRDFVLQWFPVKSQAPKAAVFTEKVDGDTYALIMLMPPAVKTNTLPRDIVFIIDTSGSMGGTSIIQAKAALSSAIDKLTTTDRFNIIEFNSNYNTLFNDWSPTNTESTNYAKHWINQLNANGGTEMLPALSAALSHSTDSERLQQVVFITDGAVGNESALFSHIHKHLGDFRLFTVGIGSAPNSYFMTQAAEFGRGSFTFIGDIQEVAGSMAELFQQLNSASHTQITIDWGTHSEQYPERISDLYYGQPLLVTAKLSDLQQVKVSGHSNQPWSQTIDINTQAHESGISALWARQKIKSLEAQGVKGTLDEEALKDKILKVALKHQLMSRFTSFIAIEETPSKPINEPTKTAAIPNAVAHGQKLQAMHYPKTATWSGLFGWLACLMLFFYAILHAIKREPSTTKAQ